MKKTGGSISIMMLKRGKINYNLFRKYCDRVARERFKKFHKIEGPILHINENILVYEQDQLLEFFITEYF